MAETRFVTDGLTDGRTDRRTDGRFDFNMPPKFLRGHKNTLKAKRKCLKKKETHTHTKIIEKTHEKPKMLDSNISHIFIRSQKGYTVLY